MKAILDKIFFVLVLIVLLASCQKGTKDPSEFTVQKRLDQGESIQDILKSNQPYNLLGRTAFGGRIFYLDLEAGEGLVVADVNLSEGTQWGCQGVDIPSADGDQIGDGEKNTNAIVGGCPFPGTAAELCWSWDYNGYTDWFLPSGGEFSEIIRIIPYKFDNICDSSHTYWTSTNDNTVLAHTFSCKWEFTNTEYKTFEAKVRAIRRFTF